MNTPLAMIASGVFLAQIDIKKMVGKKDIYFLSLVRLVIIPLVTVLLIRLIPFGSREMKLSIILAAACPVGSNVAIFAQQYDKDYQKGIEHVCISTILCAFTLPVLIYLANLLF